MIANAASINWTVTLMTIPTLDGSGYGEMGGTAHLLIGDSTAGVAAAIENGTFSSAFSVRDTATVDYGGLAASTTGIVESSLDIFLVIFDATGEYYMISNVKTATSYEPPGSGSTTTFGVGDFSGGWTPVPEPATMALLGLGVVALGLRRRRK